MVKHCDMCGIEIADTDYDTLGRYNAVKYCQECAAIRKKIANKNYRQKRKMEKQVAKATEEHELTEAAKACRKGRRAANEQTRLLKEENKFLREELMKERAKKDPRTGSNQ